MYTNIGRAGSNAFGLGEEGSLRFDCEREELETTHLRKCAPPGRSQSRSLFWDRPTVKGTRECKDNGGGSSSTRYSSFASLLRTFAPSLSHFPFAPLLRSFLGTSHVSSRNPKNRLSLHVDKLPQTRGSGTPHLSQPLIPAFLQPALVRHDHLPVDRRRSVLVLQKASVGGRKRRGGRNYGSEEDGEASNLVRRPDSVVIVRSGEELVHRVDVHE